MEKRTNFINMIYLLSLDFIHFAAHTQKHSTCLTNKSHFICYLHAEIHQNFRPSQFRRSAPSLLLILHGNFLEKARVQWNFSQSDLFIDWLVLTLNPTPNASLCNIIDFFRPTSPGFRHSTGWTCLGSNRKIAVKRISVRIVKIGDH